MSRFATLRFDLKANNIKNSGCRLHVPELLRIDSADFSETGLDGDRVLRMNQSINQSIKINQSSQLAFSSYLISSVSPPVDRGVELSTVW
jgi:hypothetical protein